MPSKTLSAEDNLLDYAVRLTHHRAGRKALFIALTALAPRNRTGGHWKLLDGVLGPLILRHGGEFFRLRCGDAVVLFASLDRAMADRLSAKLVSLFRDDPLIERSAPDAPNPLCRWWDLSRDYDAFLTQVRAIKDAADDPSGPRSVHLAQPDEEEAVPFTLTLDPTSAPLMAWLRGPVRGVAGLASVARTAAIVRWQPGAQPVRFGELVERQPQALAAVGLPGTEIERNPQLVEPLETLIDRRVMTELVKARPNSAVLTVTTRISALLGAEFLAFHDDWALGAWNPVTWLVPPDDVNADIPAYRFVRDMLKERGHRLGVGKMALDAAPALDIARLKPDLIALAWDERSVPEPRTREDRALNEWLAGPAAELVLLTGCDSRTATAQGRRWGLSLFEGSHAEALVRGAAAG